MASSSSPSNDDFSVLVLASDLGIDARPFLTTHEREREEQETEEENWHDCSQYLVPDEDFSDLERLQFFRIQGYDKSSNRIVRVVGKYFPAQVISGERLKKYIFYKIFSELPEGPFCIVYIHSTVQKEENSPGMTILRWIYEELPTEGKERLQVVYFIHPGLRSRLVFATLGRFFLSGGLYWKIKYVSRLQYLWEDIKKGEIEIPEFVKSHDDVLEHRPLTDYGIEPDPFHLNELPSMSYSFGSYQERWESREFVS
uniref:CRAL-TRIO domain-containing protein n=1 Tax=Rhizophora mucronata TaxID=61149 RepID=A0A2P2IWW0_RHIMU